MVSSLTSNRQYDVLTFSDMCVDLIVSGVDVIPQFGQVEKLVGDYTLEMGGSCNLFACQASRLGLRAGVVGRVGDDSFGALVLRRLQERGVDTLNVSVDPARKTGLGLALCPPGDRAILTYMGTINAVYPEDITGELLASTRHVHHASHYLHTNLMPGIAGIFEVAHQLGASTSLDTNWDPAERWEGGIERILPHTDVFLPNEQEALLISRSKTLAEAAQRFLGLGAKIVVIKRGVHGSQAYTNTGAINVPVEPATGGDSVGAGDSFDAGFLAGWLRGYPLAQCLAFGNACGQAVAGQAGGLAGQPTWEEITTSGRARKSIP